MPVSRLFPIVVVVILCGLAALGAAHYTSLKSSGAGSPQVRDQQKAQGEDVPPAKAVVPSVPAWAKQVVQDPIGYHAELEIGTVTQRFRWIQPGTFTMGSPTDEPGRFDDETQHHVVLTTGFWMADSTCTQALWQAVTGSNPAKFRDSSENPVEQVSWDDCQLFLTALNGQVSGAAFALPTEAQWEYACRAGTTTAYSFGPTITPEQVNYDGYLTQNASGPAVKGLRRQKTVPVKSLPPNPWGLYEMHGNLDQWCSDWSGDYSGHAERNPTGPSSGTARVVRGGSWYSLAGNCRSAIRASYQPDNRLGNYGLRLAARAAP